MSKKSYETLQTCCGQKCRTRDDCWRYRADKHPQQPPVADFSQCAEFKPTNPDSCRMFLKNKE